jgi:phospholipid N-methyltransferase
VGLSAFAPITFIRQSFRDFRSTGAVAPSSPFLARAMVKSLPAQDEMPESFRVLEVGPGTGSFTSALAVRLAHCGRLDLCELNEEFVAHLRERLKKDRRLHRLGHRVRLFQADVRLLPPHPVYDVVVSGLPFNCFSASEVHGLLEHFRCMLKPHGTLTFFEYVGIRRLQAPFVGRKRREHLKEVAKVVKTFARHYQVEHEIVTLNLPPARVRHMRFL